MCQLVIYIFQWALMFSDICVSILTSNNHKKLMHINYFPAIIQLNKITLVASYGLLLSGSTTLSVQYDQYDSSLKCSGCRPWLKKNKLSKCIHVCGKYWWLCTQKTAGMNSYKYWLEKKSLGPIYSIYFFNNLIHFIILGLHFVACTLAHYNLL